MTWRNMLLCIEVDIGTVHHDMKKYVIVYRGRYWNSSSWHEEICYCVSRYILEQFIMTWRNMLLCIEVDIGTVHHDMTKYDIVYRGIYWNSSSWHDEVWYCVSRYILEQFIMAWRSMILCIEVYIGTVHHDMKKYVIVYRGRYWNSSSWHDEVWYCVSRYILEQFIMTWRNMLLCIEVYIGTVHHDMKKYVIVYRGIYWNSSSWHEEICYCVSR